MWWANALVFLVCLCLIATQTVKAAPCSTFLQRCTVSLGKVLGDSSGANAVQLALGKSYFISFTPTEEVPFVDLDLTLLFGTVEIYAARDREPKRIDYDWSNVRSGELDHLRLTFSSASQSSSAPTHVMITAVGGSASFTALLSSQRTLSVEVIKSIPQRLSLRPSTTLSITSRVAKSDVTGSVALTSFSGPLPSFTVSLPSQSPMTAADGLALFTPQPSDVGKALVLSLSSPNASSVTLSLCVDVATAPVALAQGVSQRERVGAGSSRLFSFAVPADVTGSVTFVLESLQGDADLYVNPSSRGYYRRESTSSEEDYPDWSSARPAGRDSVTVFPEDPHYVENGFYAVSVYGYAAAEFSLRVYTARGVLTLSEEQPLLESVERGQYRYYRYAFSLPRAQLAQAQSSLDRERLSVTLDVTPFSGDADLYVGCVSRPSGDESGFPSAQSGHYNFSSAFFAEDSLSLSPLDPAACVASSSDETVDFVYYVAVFGYSSSVFALTVARGEGEIAVRAGVPVTGRVFRRTSQRYRLRLGAEAQTVAITLSPRFGDCDLYVKMVPGDRLAPLDYAPATLSDYDFRSTAFGSGADRVTINESVVCTDCVLSILVYGFEPSEFSLSVVLTDTVLVLSEGVAVRSAVGAQDVQYFSYIASSARATAVATLTVFSGATPSLYLSTRVERPNATSPHTVRRERASHDGVVPVASLCCVSAGDNVFVGVGGDGANSSFSVRVHEVSVRESDPPPVLPLSEGVPQNDAFESADEEYRHYYLSVQPGHESLTVKAASLVGDVDLYVTRCAKASVRACIGRNASSSASNSSLPSTENYLFTTESAENDVLSIPRNDAQPTVYLVAVRARSMYSAFSLSYRADSQTVLELQAGVSAVDHVAQRQSDFFSFYIEHRGKSSIQISLTPFSGDPDLFVSTTERYPSAWNSTWRSYRFGADTLTLHTQSSSDGTPAVCTECTLYIAVYGASESTYALRLTVEDTVSLLQDGLSVNARVEYLSWDHYRFRYTHTAGEAARSMRVALSPLTGNPDLYVTLDGSPPTFFHYDYASRYWSGDDSLEISPTDAAFAASPCANASLSGCEVRVGVFGFISSDYTLSLSTARTPTLLPLDRAVSGAVAHRDVALYKFLLSTQHYGANNEPYSLRVSLTPQSGHVSLLLSCAAPPLRANESMWSALYLSPTDAVRSSLVVDSLSVLDHGCLPSSGAFFATVLGDTAAEFVLRASVVRNSSAAALTASAAGVRGQVAYGAVEYYVVRPFVGTQREFEDAKLSLSAISGDVDLYVSRNWDTRPQFDANTGTVTSYAKRSSQFGDDSLVVSHGEVQDWCAAAAGERESERERDCYFVVAVVGAFGQHADGASSQYALQLSWADSIVPLTSGVPVRGHVNSQRVEYYSFSLMQRDVDVIFAVTAMSGDPDIFVSLEPNHHPNRSNFTWAQALFGGDTLTLQAADIAQHCVVEPSKARGCTFYIGVYGWRNSTYSLLAKVDDGFRTPTVLLDAQPQTGRVNTGEYTYYRYTFAVDPPGPRSTAPPVDVKFTLTPTDDGDLDLYLKIVPATQHNVTEPGKAHYDLRSAGWASVVEKVDISASSPLYCLGCVVYIAVFGYRGGSYTIQASSTGMLTLQAGDSLGGTVRKGEYAYYSFYNPDPFAEILLSVTSISGDADIYAVPHLASDTSLTLPSRSHYVWRASGFGSDSLSIDYTQRNYCSDCEIIVAIYGYTNATYFLSLHEKAASLVKLPQNRPLQMSLEANEIMYFSTSSPTSAADITLSLTPLNTGEADLFVEIYNATERLQSSSPPLPDPSDYATYSYTTQGTEDNHVFLPRPHNAEDLVVVAVKALSDVSFTIVSSVSTRPMVVRSGVPVSHFVSEGENELFMFYPESAEDVHISLVARSGDPDLLVSATDSNPHCWKPADKPWSTQCANYTWSSRLFFTDQIVLSADLPCEPALPSTSVSEQCDPAAFPLPSQRALYIAVYGYRPSKFTLTVSLASAHTHLLVGSPQLATTSQGVVCAERDRESGACTPRAAKTAKKVQVAYFSLFVSPSAAADPASRALRTTSQGRRLGALMSEKDVLLTVVPRSNCSSTSPAHCVPGCACNPLSLYVTSCAASRCSERDKKPSPVKGQFATYMSVSPSSGSTLFLSSVDSSGEQSSVSRPSPGYCDPDALGEDCMYFFAVYHENPRESAEFSVLAGTTAALSLVPCDAHTAPDGVRVSAEQRVASGAERRYEVCSQRSREKESGSEAVIVEVEQCNGSTALYACADDNSCEALMPTQHSHTYSATADASCVRTVTPSGSVRERCERSGGRATLRLPARFGSYFVLANGTGTYNLQVRNTRKGQDLAPHIVTAGIYTDTPTAAVRGVSGNTATLSWRSARVLLPGLGQAVAADELRYEVWLFDLSVLPYDTELALRGALASARGACALDYSASLLHSSSSALRRIMLPGSIVSRSENPETEDVSHTFSALDTDTEYALVIVATCDAQCLRQLSKVVTSPRVLTNCNSGSQDCHAQTMMYASTTFHTLSQSDTEADSGASTAHSHGDTALTVVVVLLAVAVAAALVVAAVRVYKTQFSGEDSGGDWDTLWERSVHSLSAWMPSADSSSHGGSPSAMSADSSAHGLAMSTFSQHGEYRPPSAEQDAPRGTGSADAVSAAKQALGGLWSSASRSLSVLRSATNAATPAHSSSTYNALPRAGAAFVVNDDDEDIEISL